MYYQPNFDVRLSDVESGLAIQEAGLSQVSSDLANVLARRYALHIDLTPVPGTFVVPNGATATLIPFPSITSEWDPTLWSLVSGVIVADGQLDGRYVAVAVVACSDTSGTPTTYTWALVRGRNLATSPVISDRYSSFAQLANVNEPTSCGMTGEIVIPDGSSLDREIGLFVSHTGDSPRTITIDALSILLVRQRDRSQI